LAGVPAKGAGYSTHGQAAHATTASQRTALASVGDRDTVSAERSTSNNSSPSSQSSRSGAMDSALVFQTPPHTLGVLHDTFNNVILGVTFMALIALYVAIGSGFPHLREMFEMNEMQFFNAWPLKSLMALLIVNLSVVTGRASPSPRALRRVVHPCRHRHAHPRHQFLLPFQGRRPHAHPRRPVDRCVLRWRNACLVCPGRCDADRSVAVEVPAAFQKLYRAGHVHRQGTPRIHAVFPHRRQNHQRAEGGESDRTAGPD